MKLGKLPMFILILFLASILSFKCFAYTNASIVNATMVSIVEPRNALISIDNGQTLSDSKGMNITNHTSGILTVNSNFANTDVINVTQGANPFTLLPGDTKEMLVKIVKKQDIISSEDKPNAEDIPIVEVQTKLSVNLTCTWDGGSSRAIINTFVYVK